MVCGSHFLPSDCKASPLLSTSATVFYGMAPADVCQAFTSPLCHSAFISVLALLSCSFYSFLYQYSSTITCLFLYYFLFLSSEENSFVALDHSGILATEFVSLLEETEYTILIDAYPSPKVTWLKDGKAMPQNYYVLTKTSHLEGNR